MSFYFGQGPHLKSHHEVFSWDSCVLLNGLLWGAIYTWSLYAVFSDWILKRPGVNALRNAFEIDVNPIAQTTSAGGLGRIPDELV